MNMFSFLILWPSAKVKTTESEFLKKRKEKKVEINDACN